MALTVGELVANIDADDSGMQRGLTAAELRMRGFQQDTEGRLRRLDGRFATMGERVAMGFATAEQSSRGFSFSLGRIGSLGGAAGPLGAVAGTVGKIAAALGAGVPAASGLVATLVQIAPAAGVAVTGLFAVQLATQALKLGMKGVGDAVSAAMDPSDPEAYAEALKKLSPSARAFVGEIRTLQPQLKALQQGVQERLFDGLDKVLKEMGKSTLPILRDNLNESAISLNFMAKGVGDAAIQLSKSGTLGKALMGANEGLANLTQIPGQLVTGLTQVGAAAAPAFARLTAAAGAGATSVSEKFTRAFASGGVESAIEDAITVFKQLFEVVGNVGSILGAVFSAAHTTGGDFLGVLTQITGAIAEAFATPAVQDGLKAIFSTMAALGQTVGPLLLAALQAIGPVFTALGPPVQRVIALLGPALGSIIAALGPVLEVAAQAIGALLDAVAPLLPVIGDLVAGLLPALTPLLALVANIFQRLAPVVARLAQILMSALAPIMAALVPVIEPIADALLVLVDAILPILTSQMEAVAPLIAQLAATFATLLVALAPVITQLILLAAKVLTDLTPAITMVMNLVSRLAAAFAGELGRVVTTVIVPALSALAMLLAGDFSGAWTAAGQAVKGAVDEWVRLLRDLPQRAYTALADLAGRLWDRVSESGGRMVAGLKQKRDEAIQQLKGLPGMAASALGDLGGVLWNAGARLVGGFVDGIKSQFNKVRSTLSNLTSMLPDWKGPAALDARILTPAGVSLIEGFQRGIAAATPALQAQLGGLTGALPGMALGSAGAGGVGAGAGVGRLIIEVTGPDEVKSFIRKIVQVDGRGDVQTAFGY